jgi:hypothetical protein
LGLASPLAPDLDIALPHSAHGRRNQGHDAASSPVLFFFSSVQYVSTFCSQSLGQVEDRFTDRSQRFARLVLRSATLDYRQEHALDKSLTAISAPQEPRSLDRELQTMIVGF